MSEKHRSDEHYFENPGDTNHSQNSLFEEIIFGKIQLLKLIDTYMHYFSSTHVSHLNNFVPVNVDDIKFAI